MADERMNGMDAAGKGKGRKKPMPAKTVLNLCMKEKSNLRPERYIPGILAVLIVAVLFGKFAVYDRYARLAEQEAVLTEQKDALEALESNFADYDNVLKEYEQYNYTGYDRTIADRQELMSLMERDVFPVADLTHLYISGKTLSTSLSGLTLDQLSGLIEKLEAEPLVSHVTVSTAGYDASSWVDRVNPDGTVDRIQTNLNQRVDMTIDLADANTAESVANAAVSEGGGN